ncbi:hypothetical protein EDB85DRAFT_2199873 [Lactarius pseudohatsudake]|nr:hypothetical protein EDB85DRAFT_2199873 [Lactarius pseudohatsudake]
MDVEDATMIAQHQVKHLQVKRRSLYTLGWVQGSQGECKLRTVGHSTTKLKKKGLNMKNQTTNFQLRDKRKRGKYRKSAGREEEGAVRGFRQGLEDNFLDDLEDWWVLKGEKGRAPNTGVKPDKAPGTSWGGNPFTETFPQDTLGAAVWKVLWDLAHWQYPLKTPKWFKPGFEPRTLLPKAGDCRSNPRGGGTSTKPPRPDSL